MNNQLSGNLTVSGSGQVWKDLIPVGQGNLPAWKDFEKSFRNIFSRQYYTNQGPLAQKLELKLQQFLGVRHAICVTNETIGLMIAAKALGLKGKVICPAFACVGTAQSVGWAGLEPVFCDVDENHQLSTASARKLIDKDVCAILGVHLWGNPCNPSALQELSDRYNLKLYFDSSQAFGSIFNGKMAGGFGDLEIFSFNKNHILSSFEGGCVCTNDDHLAAKLRNIRSSYGAGKTVAIPLTGNGRMSEAQAALALLSLQNYTKNKARNKKFVAFYEALLDDVPGLRMVKPNPGNDSNYQSAVIEIDEESFGITGRKLAGLLLQKKVASFRISGLHRTHPYSKNSSVYGNTLPMTDKLSKAVLQLPSGQNVNRGIIKEISRLIRLIYENSVGVDTIKAGSQ